MKFSYLAGIAVASVLYSPIAGAFDIKAENKGLKHPRVEAGGVIMEFSPYWSTEYKIVVEPGDNLTRIAESVSESAGHKVIWQEIYDQNRGKIKDSNMIFPGQELTYVDSQPSGSGLRITM
ncbi:MAG: LysM peptidoglycan-binding domain-containing protein [Candidatus Aenigmarchaeota archaeon]|nr:LysM peptidoglycan-binding domain-containing protein [Candidatus Aenigmarchaeota archaeon]